MYCERSVTTVAPQLVEVRMEKSLAYERSHDFGPDAYCRVVRRYQTNMIEKLALLFATKDTGDVLWQLQSIRNCSAQLGVVSVVEQCDALKGLVLKAPLSRRNLLQLQVTVDACVSEMTRLGDSRSAA